ncbi:MAG: shikimate kinase [Gammaproteobacteria bacterium]|nr:shikimate kinase [Gammaproteobacteria bacterium]
MTGNVVLIGMPGAGKSTIGVLLAKRLGYDFVDTDVLIQIREGQILQDTLDAYGYLALRAIEEEVLLSLHASRTVIATGGSAVYSDKAMQYLAKDGTIVYLAADLDDLRGRIHDYESRGIARRPDQDLSDLYAERTRLYGKYAEITVAAAPPPEEVVAAIEKALPADQMPAT